MSPFLTEIVEAKSLLIELTLICASVAITRPLGAFLANIDLIWEGCLKYVTVGDSATDRRIRSLCKILIQISWSVYDFGVSAHTHNQNNSLEQRNDAQGGNFR